MIRPPDHAGFAWPWQEPTRETRLLSFFRTDSPLVNLFCGMFAIISAARGQFDLAGFLIVAGGVADALDGRVARATGTGSRFGSELDSLVDIITFGLAPAMIMYFAVLNREGWELAHRLFFMSPALPSGWPASTSSRRGARRNIFTACRARRRE